MNITLDSDLQKLIDDQVKSGTYSSPVEVIRAALEALRDQEDLLSPHAPEELRREIAGAISQLDRGEGTPWDAEEIKAEGRALLAARRNQPQGKR